MLCPVCGNWDVSLLISFGKVTLILIFFVPYVYNSIHLLLWTVFILAILSNSAPIDEGNVMDNMAESKLSWQKFPQVVVNLYPMNYSWKMMILGLFYWQNMLHILHIRRVFTFKKYIIGGLTHNNVSILNVLEMKLWKVSENTYKFPRNINFLNKI